MKYDVIIIGSGLASLTAATMLTKNKKKVLVLEKHNIAGGCATTYRRKNMTFEVGLHEIDFNTNFLDMKHVIFRKLGIDKKINLIPIDNMFRLKTETEDFIMPEGYSKAINVLIEKYPNEKLGIKKYFRKLKLIAFMGRRLPYDMNFFEFLLYPITTLPIFLYYYFSQKSVGQTFDNIIKNDALKRILNTNLVYYHDNPYKFIFQYHAAAQAAYYNKACFIKGGSSMLSDALVNVIKENGGDVLLSSEAKKINIINGKAVSVEWQDKNKNIGVSQAKKIIANCSPDILYNKLLDKKYEDKELLKLEKSVSLYTVYIIFKKKLSGIYKNNAYSTFIDEDKNMKSTFSKTDGEIKNMKIDKRKFVFVDYSKIDAALTDEGDNRSFGVLTGPSYIDEWQNLTQEEYKTKKNNLAKSLFKRMEEHYPNFEENIEYYEVSTPKTLMRYTGTETAYGYAQNSHLRKGRVRRKSPTVKNIHFASAFAYPGGGFTGAIIGGYMAARDILFPMPLYIICRTIFTAFVCSAISSAHIWIAFISYFVK